MTSRTRETLYGSIAVLLGAAVLTYNVLETHEEVARDDGTMTLTATFNRVDGLREGAPVRMAGVPVGVVSGMRLTEGYRAETRMRVRGDLALPEDTAAVIETEGLFGDKYVELQPGGALDELGAGDRISYTQDSVILEELLAKIIARAKAAREAAGPAGGAGSDTGAGAGVGEDAAPGGQAAPPGDSPFPSLLD